MRPSRRAQGRAPPAITAKPLRRDEVGDMITTSKAGDPVIRGASDGTEEPRRTGYPAGACHQARPKARPGGGGYDGSLWSCEAIFNLALRNALVLPGLDQFKPRMTAYQSPIPTISCIISSSYRKCLAIVARYGISAPQLSTATRNRPHPPQRLAAVEIFRS